MKGFEAPLRTQLRHVLLGMTAEGSRKHLLWPLPHIVKSQRRRILALGYWYLLRAGSYLNERDDVRTFGLWIIAAHMERLDRVGNTQERVDREIGWLGAIMTEDLDFVRTSSFAMRLMPDFMPRVPLKERAKTRAPVLARLNSLRLAQRQSEQPTPVVAEPGYTVLRYRNPRHFSTNLYLASTWEAHIAALERGEDVDHGYWHEIAQEDRMVFALHIAGACAATFESRDGQLEHLMVYAPATDDVFHALAESIAQLATIHGNAFKIEGGATPAILRLQAIKERRNRELKDAMKKAEAAWNAEPPGIPPVHRTTSFSVAQKWLGYVFVAFCLSFIVPALIVAAPMFGRTYVHVWKVALGLEPDCAYPAAHYILGGVDCQFPEAPAKKGNQLPPAERGQP